MAETKMNKTRRSAGRLRSSIWLKCNFIFTIKKFLFFFTQSATYPSKVLGRRFDPNTTMKWSTKVQKSTRLRDFEREGHHASHSDKNKEPGLLPIKPTFQLYHRRLIAIDPRPTPCHNTKPAAQERLTPTLPLTLYLVEAGPYIFWHTNFYLFK